MAMVFSQYQDLSWRYDSAAPTSCCTLLPIGTACNRDGFQYIDFVVACGTDTSHDSFSLAPVVRWQPTDANIMIDRRVWDYAEDFGPPPPAPLNPLEQYAQVLLLTNEFMFID